MSDLIEDLLVAARSDIGKVSVRIGAFDVASAVRGVLGGLRPRERARITQRWGDAITGGDGVALVDPVRLRQVMRNLISNALRYGGEEIDIEILPRETSVVVRVCDNGRGIAEDDRERIFEPYHVAHDSAGQPSSVGLGLTVSRRLAELMAGSLEYHHDNGAVFELTLPRAAEQVSIGLVEDANLSM